MLGFVPHRILRWLDIGTSKVAAIIGEVSGAGEIEIVGIGAYLSRGLKKGVVVNIESTVQSIQQAVEEAERQAQCKIHSVFTGIAGSHIRSFNSHGVTAIKAGEVTNDIAVALHTPTQFAEDIKIRHACCLTQLAPRGLAVP